jgi:hypothetical protein
LSPSYFTRLFAKSRPFPVPMKSFVSHRSPDPRSCHGNRADMRRDEASRMTAQLPVLERQYNPYLRSALRMSTLTLASKAVHRKSEKLHY